MGELTRPIQRSSRSQDLSDACRGHIGQYASPDEEVDVEPEVIAAVIGAAGTVLVAIGLQVTNALERRQADARRAEERASDRGAEATERQQTRTEEFLFQFAEAYWRCVPEQIGVLAPLPALRIIEAKGAERAHRRVPGGCQRRAGSGGRRPVVNPDLRSRSGDMEHRRNAPAPVSLPSPGGRRR
jgi:hypothetical protein